MLDFINNLSTSVFTDLVQNSKLYLRNSDQLVGILEHFSDFTNILNEQLHEVQNSISNMKDNVHTSNETMDYISNLSRELATRTNDIREELNLTKQIGTSLNQELGKFSI